MCVSVCVCFCSTNQDALTSSAVSDAAAAAAAAVTSRNLLSPHDDVTSCYGNSPGQQLSLVGNTHDVTRCHGNAPSRQFALVGDESTCPDPGFAVPVVSCPVITVSADSELADIGDSLLVADLPPHSDWLLSSSSLANHDSGLLTLRSLDTNDRSFDAEVFQDLDVTDGTETFDDSLTDDSTKLAGKHTSNCQI